MIKRLISAALAVALVGGCGSLALAATGGPSNGNNAAISQYETPPTTPKPRRQAELTESHGVKGAHKKGGKPNLGGSGRAPGWSGTGKGSAAPIETASTGPVSAATGLPFTGLDALRLGGVGLLLLGGGLAQRRFESKAPRLMREGAPNRASRPPAPGQRRGEAPVAQRRLRCRTAMGAEVLGPDVDFLIAAQSADSEAHSELGVVAEDVRPVLGRVDPGAEISSARWRIRRSPRRGSRRPANRVPGDS